MILLATVTLLSVLSIGSSSGSGSRGMFTTIPSLLQSTRGGQAHAAGGDPVRIPQEFMNGGNVEMRKKFEKLCRDAQVIPLTSPSSSPTHCLPRAQSAKP